jgi:TolB protein
VTPAAIDAFDPATGTVHQLVLGGEPAWSQDGTKLAYARGGEVYVANADGSAEKAVGAGNDPSWSQDGAALAVSRADGLGIRQIYVLQLGDGTSTQLTFGTANALLPAWSPDGQTIVFDTQSTLDAVPAQGGAVRAMPLPVQTNGGASWAPGGDRIAFVAGNGQVWMASSAGSADYQVRSR